MKHSASYNSPGSLSSPVIVAAAFPATVGTSGALRPQSWSRQRSHIKTPHTLLVNANTKSNVVQRANRVSARSLNSVHEGAIPPHNNNNNNHNSKAVHEPHVRRGHRQPRRPRKNGRGSAAADEEEAAEETAAAPSHAGEKESITDAAAVRVKQPQEQQEQEEEEEMKAARKTRRRQTRRRKHTAQADQHPHGEEEQQQPQQQEVKLCEKNEEAKKAVTTSAAAVMVGNETTTTQPSVQSCVQNTQSSTTRPSNEATCVEMLSHPLPSHAERTDSAAHNEPQPLRRQRRRRAQQRLKRKQRRAHDEGTHSTTPTPPSPPSPHTETHTETNAAPSLGVPLPLQGQDATQAKGSGCSTTTNTTTTTSLSSSSQYEEQQTRPTHEGRHSTEHHNHHIAVTTMNVMMMNDTEKPKRPRRRRQRRQRLQRQAAAEASEGTDIQLSHAPAKEEEKEKKAAAAAAIGRESSTPLVPASSPLVPDAAEEDETHTFSNRTHNAATSSALLSSHIPSLLSAPPAAMARSSQKRSAASPPSRPTAASYNTQVNTHTSTSNVSMSITRGSPARRVGMLAAFPSRPDLTQLAFTDLATLPSTTAFSLSSGVTAGLNEEDEEVQCEGREEDNTSPMTLATSCSPASANAPAPNVYGRNAKRTTTTTTTTTTTDPNAMNTSMGRGAEEDEVGLRRRGLRVRAVAFQPRHASGDEKDMQTGDEASMSGPIAAMMQSQSEYEEPQEGAEAAVVRARRSRRARPLIRHNFSVSDVDNVQHSCVAMSDVVAKDETLMFNMLVHSDEAGNAGANEGDEEEGSGIRAAGNDANGEAGEEEEQEDDDDDDDEEEEEVLMDLCGLRGAAPHAASVPRHLAPGGGYWSEDNSHSAVWSAAGGMSSCGPSRPGQELSSYYYGMSYGRVSHRASQPPASQQRQRSQPSLSYYETLTPQIAALLPPHGNLSLHTSPTRTNRGTMSVMSTTEVMTDVDQWEMNSSAYEESLDEAQVQWIEEQLRASENPEGFFG